MATNKSYKVKNGDIIIGNNRSYEVLNCIGRGGFGKVVRGLNLSTKMEVALKVHRKNNKDNMKRELKMLQKVSALDSEENNIVKFIDHFKFRKRYFFAFEMLDKTLWHLMRERGLVPLKLSQISYVMEQLLVAFKGLKSIGIVHCDLKLENIMLVNHCDQPFKIKLIDFGLALHMSKLEVGLQVHPVVNRAPEAILALPLTEAVDIWAIASIICQLYFCRELFPRECIYYSMKAIVKLLGLPSDHLLENGLNTDLFFKRGKDGVWKLVPPEVFESLAEIETEPTVSVSDFCETLGVAVLISKNKDEHSQKCLFLDLLSRCLQIDPAQRITVEEALQHDFITHRNPLDINDNNIFTFPVGTIDSEDSESSDSQSNSSSPRCAGGAKSCKSRVNSNEHSSSSSGSNHVPVSDASVQSIAPPPSLNSKQEEVDIDRANPVDGESSGYINEISKSEDREQQNINNYNLSVCAATSIECRNNTDATSNRSGSESVLASDASIQLIAPPPSLDIEQEEDDINCANPVEIKPGDAVPELPIYTREISESEDKKVGKNVNNYNLDACAATPTECSHNIDSSSNGRWESVPAVDAHVQLVLPPSSFNIKQLGTLTEDDIDRANRRGKKTGDPVPHLPGYIGEISEDEDQKLWQTTATVNNNHKEKIVIFSSNVDAIAISSSEDLSSSSSVEHNVNSNNQPPTYHIQMQQKTIQNLLAEVTELHKNYNEVKSLLETEQKKTEKLHKKLQHFKGKEKERDSNVAPIPELKEKKPSLWKRFKQLFKRK